MPQGNPFFIEEIVQVLFDDGVLMRDGAVLSVAHPPSLQNLVEDGETDIFAARRR